MLEADTLINGARLGLEFLLLVQVSLIRLDMKHMWKNIDAIWARLNGKEAL